MGNINLKSYKDIDQVKLDKTKINYLFYKDIYKLFKGYKCLKCLQEGFVDYERDPETSNLFIIFECYNSHKERKLFDNFINENYMINLGNIIVYDFVPSKYRKKKIEKKDQKYTDIKDEYLILCIKCRKGFLVTKDMLKDVKHKHDIYQYNVASDIYENLGKKSIEYGFIEDEDLNKIRNKVSEEEKYLKEIKELYKKREWSYYKFEPFLNMNMLEKEIKFIREIFDYSDKMNNGEKFNYFNLLNLYNYKIPLFKNPFFEIHTFNNNIKKLYSNYKLRGESEKLIKGNFIKKYFNYSVKRLILLDFPYFATIISLKFLIFKIENNNNQIIEIFRLNNIYNPHFPLLVFDGVYIGNNKIIIRTDDQLQLLEFKPDYLHFAMLYKLHFVHNSYSKTLTYLTNNYFILFGDYVLFYQILNNNKFQLTSTIKEKYSEIIEINSNILLFRKEKTFYLFDFEKFNFINKIDYSEKISKCQKCNNQNLILANSLTDLYLIDIYTGNTIKTFKINNTKYGRYYISNFISCKGNENIFFIFTSAEENINFHYKQKYIIINQLNINEEELLLEELEAIEINNYVYSLNLALFDNLTLIFINDNYLYISS